MKKLTSKKLVMKGFTLVELLITIVVLGILGSLATGSFGGLTDQAKASAKMQIATEGTKLASMLFTTLGSGKNTPTNPAIHVSNSLEDVIFTGRGISATYQARFDPLKMPNLRDSVIITTEPVEDTSKGVYQLDGASVVSIQPAGSTSEMRWQFTNTTTEEVGYLVSKYDTARAFNPAAADTTGRIRYSAASNGLHTLTIVTSL